MHEFHSRKNTVEHIEGQTAFKPHKIDKLLTITLKLIVLSFPQEGSHISFATLNQHQQLSLGLVPTGKMNIVSLNKSMLFVQLKLCKVFHFFAGSTHLFVAINN